MTFQEREYQEGVVDDILRLKKERNAVILAHNYQRNEVQDIADITGDSYALAKAATQTDAEVIVFCGVLFMAESAAILNPGKVVLQPVLDAGCTMADMVSVDDVRMLRKQYPKAAVVCYVNSSAAVKAESDICCTSSNAIQVVNSLSEDQVIFVPDKNLGQYVQQHTHKQMILWRGFCATHAHLIDTKVLEAKEKYPLAEVVAHPECNPDVLLLAHHICSTAGMLKAVKKSKARDFIICTEKGFLYTLKKENPEKNFYSPIEHMICADMKLTTLGWIAHSLTNMVHVVEVSAEIRSKAKKALDRMLEVNA